MRGGFSRELARQRAREKAHHLGDHLLRVPRPALCNSTQVPRYPEQVGKFQNEAVILGVPFFCVGVRHADL